MTVLEAILAGVAFLGASLVFLAFAVATAYLLDWVVDKIDGRR